MLNHMKVLILMNVDTMQWPYPTAIFLIAALVISWIESTVMSQCAVFHSCDNGTYTSSNENCCPRTFGEKLIHKGHKYSGWSEWSGCDEGGRRTRRRHCIQRSVCHDLLVVQVARCYNQNRILRVKKVKENKMNRINKTLVHIQTIQRRQLNADEVQKRIRGFSPWTKWTLCSRKCTTVRRRFCMVPAICGRKILRQSAYCYLDGGFCQQWVRQRMQMRRDPGREIRGRTFQFPITMNQFDNGNQSPQVPSEPECGRLGHYRGSAVDHMRARMQDMVRIIGGRPAPPGKWPWQVAVLNRYKEAFCGGTLISLRWVVSAAHCVRRRLYVRLGEHDLFLRSPGEVEMRVLKTVVHPKYDPDTVINDVAMLKLPSPARTELGHGVACLPQSNQRLMPHTSCVILGWGKKRATDTHGTRLLHEAQVSTIDQGVCRHSYWQYMITEDMICAGRGRRDSCAGDSGGPLLCRAADMRYYLQGITSFGDGCGKLDKFGIYTRTSGYVDWMKNVMRSGLKLFN